MHSFDHSFDSALPQHGGRLRAAAHDYRIPARHWLDLSTGINPLGWSVPTLPPEVWQRLPEDDDGLYMAVQAYFRGVPALPVAGSQAAIQSLPRLRADLRGRSRVSILSPAYAEHAQAWRLGGHEVMELGHRDVETRLGGVDVLIVVNPNNPTGAVTPRDALLRWHGELAARGGWLVVDEAFVDATPDLSVAGHAAEPGLIVLRSLGKFWGLAGVRAGFVLAEGKLLSGLRAQVGPWAMSHPARWIAQRALADRAWQAAMRERLQSESERLAALLGRYGLDSPNGTALFRWVPTSDAAKLFDAFARRAVQVRAFNNGLRFGLPGTEEGWTKLEAALREVRR